MTQMLPNSIENWFHVVFSQTYIIVFVFIFIWFLEIIALLLSAHTHSPFLFEHKITDVMWHWLHLENYWRHENIFSFEKKKRKWTQNKQCLNIGACREFDPHTNNLKCTWPLHFALYLKNEASHGFYVIYS